MTNGAMNVEIGNPAYKIYEGEPDDDAGELLDSDFTLDPDKVIITSRPDTNKLIELIDYLCVSRIHSVVCYKLIMSVINFRHFSNSELSHSITWCQFLVSGSQTQ